MTETPPIILTKGLTKTYGADDLPVRALRDVELSLGTGEFVALMGPSGCGKSTLLHMLDGLDRPTGGEVWLGGQRVDGLSEAKWAVLRRAHIGFVFQFFNLIGNLTVADNVELPALLAGLAANEARARRSQLLDQLGLAGKADAVPAQLSGGQQQRVALARALINRPAVLLADEPTGNLDTAAAREVLDLLKRYHAEGQTILLATHDARVASAADRIMTMRDGRLAGENVLTPESATTRPLSDLIQLEA